MNEEDQLDLPISKLPENPGRFIHRALPKRERERLGRHCRLMLELLEARDRVANTELALISLKYTGRISDLRARGYDIPPPEKDPITPGVRWYRLGTIKRGADSK